MTTLLSRIPGIVWVGVLVSAVAGMFVGGIYAAGWRNAQLAVHRAALADSAQVAHAKVAVATRASDSTVQVARNWHSQTMDARARWESQRTAVAAALAASPPAVQQLVDSAAATIARLDTTVTAGVIAQQHLLAERATRIEADTVEAHQAQLSASGSGVSAGDVAKGAAFIATGVVVVRWIVQRVHR